MEVRYQLRYSPLITGRTYLTSRCRCRRHPEPRMRAGSVRHLAVPALCQLSYSLAATPDRQITAPH